MLAELVEAGFVVHQPVHDHTGRPVAAVAVTVPTEDSVPCDELAPRVVHAAAELTRRMGRRPPERGRTDTSGV